LASACQRLWLVHVNDAYGGSHMLGVSFSLTLWPPWRWQSWRFPHGTLHRLRGEYCLGSFRPDRCQSRRCQ